jgi:hypothetical protein
MFPLYSINKMVLLKATDKASRHTRFALSGEGNHNAQAVSEILGLGSRFSALILQVSSSIKFVNAWITTMTYVYTNYAPAGCTKPPSQLGRLNIPNAKPSCPSQKSSLQSQLSNALLCNVCAVTTSRNTQTIFNSMPTGLRNKNSVSKLKNTTQVMQ